MAITVVLADDHPLLLSGLSNLLALESDIRVLACCGDGNGAWAEVLRLRPGIAVLDVRMPGLSGIEVARRIRDERLDTRVVLLTAELQEEEMIDAARLGIEGVVLKEMAPQFIVQCIRKVHEGGHWVERRTTKQLLEKVLRREAGVREVAALLTRREIELVRMVAGGQRNREIGAQLFISEGTVKVHLHNIYRKLGIDGRLALLRYAKEKGVA